MGQKRKLKRKGDWLFPSCLPVSSVFCQQRIHERWKPSTPLAQIPLCTHKRRNSSKITEKQELFPSSWPQEFSEWEGQSRNFFWKRCGAHFHMCSSEPCEEVSVVDCVRVLLFFLCTDAYTLHLCVCVCVCAAESWEVEEVQRAD